VTDSLDPLGAAVRAVAGTAVVEPLPLRRGPRERVTLSPEAQGRAPAGAETPPGLASYRRRVLAAPARPEPSAPPLPEARVRHRHVAVYARAAARALDTAAVAVSAREAAAVRTAA